MEKLNLSFFVKNAREKLTGRNAARMAAIHTGVIVLAGVILTLTQWMLAKNIEGATGLSGLGTVSLLQTMQTVLQWANILLVPFWNLGFLYVALRWARGESAQTGDLLMGFHRVRPCIGLLLNRLLISFGVMFFCVYACSAIYMMLPVSTELMALIGDAGADIEAAYAALGQMDLTTLTRLLAPMLILSGVMYLAILTPMLYRIRLTEYVILDNRGIRAFPAMLISATLLRRRCWQLFKLDLRFWWYYGLKVLCILLCYGEVVLQMLGISLPMGEDGAFLLFYVLYLLMLLGVEVCFRPRVDTAYGCFYEALKEMGPIPPKRRGALMQKIPWNEE